MKSLKTNITNFYVCLKCDFLASCFEHELITLGVGIKEGVETPLHIMSILITETLILLSSTNLISPHLYSNFTS